MQFTTSNVAADRLRRVQESFREELIQLSLEVNPVNLGAGNYDCVAPEFVTKALSEAVTGPNILLNQYTRGYGHPRLVNALSKLYSKLLGRELDSFKEILVTVGAYGALHCAVMALINPGDEVFTCLELGMIAELCKEHNVICVMDETYEWLVFKGSEHIRMATLPGMSKLTITIGSAGKTFNVTGWKCGWVYGPQSLIHCLQLYHTGCQRACITPIQEAIAVGLENEMENSGTQDSYLKDRIERLELKRDCMAKFLSSVGMIPVIPEGGYFIIADFSELGTKIGLNLDDEQGTKDYKFVKWLCRNKKLQVFPLSIFYCVEHKHLGGDFVCFCFVESRNHHSVMVLFYHLYQQKYKNPNRKLLYRSEEPDFIFSKGLVTLVFCMRF
ncbi:kynurenine aminotransferase-like isoform X12 [Tachypleus tridentatus]|uniref:kynurenine aminotransferase-like isoform X12 n=1 Tax=Tachypleus tridentatus TaxID=6853 RepID=UPI003FD465AD